MIGALQLILDQDQGSAIGVPAENVRAERTDVGLLSVEFQFDAQRLGQDGQVFFGSQPRREVLRFRLPDLAQLDSFETSQLVHRAR